MIILHIIHITLLDKLLNNIFHCFYDKKIKKNEYIT